MIFPNILFTLNAFWGHCEDDEMAQRHFSFTELVAYKLGTRSGIVEKLDRHLREGCPACERELAVVGQLIQTSARNAAATPPRPLVDRIRKEALQRFPNRTATEPRAGAVPIEVCTARLVFDSMVQPVLAGLRGALRPDRHIVYTERELLLDVNISPDQQSESQSIIGQVQGHSLEKASLAGLPVLLLRQEKMVMGTKTNRFGEFVFEKAPLQEVTLCLVCSNRQVRMPCPLPGHAFGSFAGTQETSK